MVLPVGRCGWDGAENLGCNSSLEARVSVNSQLTLLGLQVPGDSPNLPFFALLFPPMKRSHRRAYSSVCADAS